VELLVQPVLAAEPFQFPHDLRVLAEGEAGVDERLLGLYEPVVEPQRLLVEPGQLGHVRQGPTAPQGDRRLQVGRAIARIGGPQPVQDQGLRGLDVGGAGTEVEEVAERAPSVRRR
jgi:hypothetical protein